MKALSIHAPYAILIADGAKDIEYRSWSTKYRGPLLICSTKFKDSAWTAKLPLGKAICVVDLVDCTYSAEDDIYHWHLAKPRPVELQAIKGQQGLYTPKLNQPLKYLDIKSSEELLSYYESMGYLI